MLWQNDQAEQSSEDAFTMNADQKEQAYTVKQHIPYHPLYPSGAYMMGLPFSDAVWFPGMQRFPVADEFEKNRLPYKDAYPYDENGDPQNVNNLL